MSSQDLRRAPGHAGATRASRWRPALLPGVLATICLLASACGLPYDTSPRPLTGDLPQALTNAPATVPSTTLSPQGHFPLASVTYVQDSKLVSFHQPVQNPLGIAEVLTTLEAGPSPFQAAASTGGAVTNDVPVGSNLRVLGVVHGVAHIAADSTFFELESAQAALELGQIVYTLTQTAALGVTAVQFYFGGSATSVVNARGQVVTGTIDQSDYCAEAKAGCPQRKKPAKA